VFDIVNNAKIYVLLHRIEKDFVLFLCQFEIKLMYIVCIVIL